MAKLRVTRHAARRWADRGGSHRPSVDAAIRGRAFVDGRLLVGLPGDLARAIGCPGGWGGSWATTGAEVLLRRDGHVITVLALDLEQLATVVVWALCGLVP